MKHILLISTILLFGCDPDIKEKKEALYVQEGAVVEVTGKVFGWFFEGDGGCFATLSINDKNIELWAHADLCDSIDYQEGQLAKFDITYKNENQYDSEGKTMYTIVKFYKIHNKSLNRTRYANASHAR